MGMCVMQRGLLACTGLTHIDDERDRAVVLDCLHVFCVPCISRWAKLRRECPLCKGFFKASSLILQFIAAEPLLLVGACLIP